MTSPNTNNQANNLVEPHPMMPKVNHDEIAEQMFVSDLKTFIGREIESGQRNLMTNKVVPMITKKKGQAPANHIEIRGEMEKEPDYQAWATLNRTAQEMMWDSVASCVDRQLDKLVDKSDVKAPKGSLTLDPNFVVPRYIDAFDIHCMPGNYHAVTRPNDVRQGAVFDRAAAIYHMGRNGGFMNDVRGHTIVSHLFERWPDLQPKRILDIGCTVGHSTVAIASYFPDADVHGIDVGAGLLRYAWARAEHVGIGIHFSQQNAEETNFPDNHFDMVVSSAMLHETSHAALPRIMKECHRVLKPGGVVIHLEVPGHYSQLDTWGRIRGDFEIFYNNEPFWRGALSTDFKAKVEEAGFKDVKAGYQDAAAKAVRGAAPAFRDKSKGVHQSWFIASGVK